MAAMAMQTVQIAHIDVGSSRRALSRPAVKRLAESMQDIGLLCPVVVVRVGDAYELIAGRHRLAAAKSLGWEEISAVLVELDDLDRRLAEIDENLIRNELRAMERAEHLAERKRLYLLKHPETKRGAQGGGRDGVGTRQRTETEIISFTADAAEKIGVTDRSIRQDVQIAESIPEDVRDALRETPLADSKTDLLDMARLPEEIQREVIATADLTSKESVRQAVAAHKPTKPAPQSPQPEPEPQEEQEAHTTEVIATVEAFAVAIAALFSVNERRRLMRLIADDIKQEAALSGN